MNVKFRDYRDFVIWFDAWTEDKKKLTSAELERLREAVHSIPLAPVVAPQSPKPVGTNDPQKPRPAMSGGVAMSAGP
jgi:hypothetical protein